MGGRRREKRKESEKQEMKERTNALGRYVRCRTWDRGEEGNEEKEGNKEQIRCRGEKMKEEK